MPDIDEISFDFPGMYISGLRNRQKTGVEKRHNVLAIHGWLDNANSFVPIMPHINDANIVAIDLPGHGKSGHLGPAACYHLMDMSSWFFKIAAQLDWNQFHIMGHSLGGCLATIAAVANPDPVLSIIMLEASGPLSEDASALPARLKKSYRDSVSVGLSKPREFTELEHAIDARLAATQMNESAARLIVTRQLTKNDAGNYLWRYDARHRAASPVYLLESQVLEILQAVTCPTLNITSKNGYISDTQNSNARLTALKNATLAQVEGHHHMHMDDPLPTAAHINDFLSSHTTPKDHFQTPNH